MWKEKIRAFKNSGKTQREWCEETGVKISTLQYWIRKENSGSEISEETPRWIALEPYYKQGSISITVGQAKIDIEKDFDPQVLKSVVKILGELC